MTDPDTSVVPTDEHPSYGATDTTEGHDDSNHNFQIKHFTKPTYCKFCDRFIFGLYKQGYRCQGELLGYSI